jgi:nucleotide-binding universal stress UspA family protein
MFESRKEVAMTPRKRLNILFADDGSEHAQSAVALLQDLSLPLKSRVLVVRAFNSGQITMTPDFERSLERAKDQLSGSGFRVETELKLGSPAEVILGHAETQKPDLIVLGAKGLRATAGIFLGGVAQQVVEYACCPVLIVRAPYRGLKRILLVSDGSLHSRRAARYLAKFPLPESVDVHAIHVLPPLERPVMMEPHYAGWRTVYARYLSREEETAIRRREEREGKALLKRTSDLLLRQGIKSTSVLTHGDAATEIIEYATVQQMDLIVAGSRGLSQFKSLWVGSVSRKLVHYSKCSVLIVKGPMKE